MNASRGFFDIIDISLHRLPQLPKLLAFCVAYSSWQLLSS